jgi:transcriptional regulator with XRE-family HTH domain
VFLIVDKIIEMPKMRNTMPASNPVAADQTAKELLKLGQQIRERRKSLRVNATAAAQSAGMSRVTLHRIENGEPSVTIGAYFNAMAALGLRIGILASATSMAAETEKLRKDWIPARIHLVDYPELRRLAWQVHGTDELTPIEALNIYDRNVRHTDPSALEPREQHLIAALRLALGTASSHV